MLEALKLLNLGKVVGIVVIPSVFSGSDYD
jgi:hypothetical protein